MVVLSEPVFDNCIIQCKKPIFAGIPVVDLSEADAKTRIVEACEEFGFFKVINHGVPLEFLKRLENEAVEFFKLPQLEKDKSGPANPFGYGSNSIGINGDLGWVEYLLFSAGENFPGIPTALLELVKEYVNQVKKAANRVLEMMAEELGFESVDCFSRLMNDEKSDSLFRINHYPPWTAEDAGTVIGFGEHTDPQIISVVRSNNISGLQICLKDGAWVPVPPDHTSFFFNVGDSLQVLTNGRFMSVKHRVVAEGEKSRVSMIFFAGPPLTEKITPLSSLMADGEESLYKEFTWSEYKKSAYKTRLGENRLRNFEKNP